MQMPEILLCILVSLYFMMAASLILKEVTMRGRVVKCNVAQVEVEELSNQKLGNIFILLLVSYTLWTRKQQCIEISGRTII